jgi:hypothetical protein
MGLHWIYSQIKLDTLQKKQRLISSNVLCTYAVTATEMTVILSFLYDSRIAVY